MGENKPKKSAAEVTKDKPLQPTSSAVWMGRYQSASKIVKKSPNICHFKKFILSREDIKFPAPQLLLYRK